MTSQLLILAVLIIFSAIFSGSETALISISKSKVDELVSQKKRNSKLLKKLKKNPHRLLITILIGNNVVNIGASAYAAVIFTDFYGSSGVGIATGLMTFFILVFGEITPKSFSHQHSVRVSLIMTRPIYYLQIIFYPLVWLFEKIVHFVNRITGSKKNITVTEGEIVAMLKIGTEEGSIEKQEQELIENILEFNDIEVEEVMTPRVAIDALDSELSLGQAVDFAIEHSHSRLPVYEKNLDHIIGVISIRELLKFYHDYPRKRKLRTLPLNLPLETPHAKKINKLFREFQRKHIHIAIVIDEFGGTAGLVTIEDLLEEIVGEIVDETDILESPIRIIDKQTIITSGNTLVEDINDFFRMKFGENEHDTIHTMIVEHLHRFPREGEVINFPKAKVEIQKMKQNIVEKVKIRRKRSKK